MNKRQISYLILLTCLMALAGCAIGRRGGHSDTLDDAAARPEYGPNPLADCLRWPKDAPHVEPLYAP